MVRFLSYSTKKTDNERIILSVRDTAAVTDRQEWECTAFLDLGQAAKRLKTAAVDLISWDMSKEDGRTAIASARRSCEEAFLLAVADQETSPLAFLTPSINPNSLILRPLTSKELRRVSREMVQAIRRQRESSEEDDWIINRRDEQRHIPYRAIYYFEARSRKVYVRLRGEEIGFTGTLDEIEEKLPAQFKRCHRSYIVNTARIERVQLSQNVICLWDGLSVPLSRSFKKTFKEAADE